MACLVIAGKILGLSISYELLARSSNKPDKADEKAYLVRAAREGGFKARLVREEANRLPALPLPAIAELQDGRFFLLVKASKEAVLAFYPWEKAPRKLSLVELKEVWTGNLIFLQKKFAWKQLEETFSIRWFLPAILKYRRLFLDVLAASFFLQIFGLITPLFSQVIIDKVLVHHSTTTLDILALGMLFVAVFETVMGVLRTWLFSHTTNRIDVVLGARLFHHLLALPMKYFEVRRVGDSIARVRELENIRQFLTGSALTVVMDMFFGTVFIIVMFLYSTKLALIALLALPFFIGLSIFATPIFRERLQDKFETGAESQAYLVESVTGIRTLKSLSIEPQMQERWENVLSRYVKASFRTAMVSNVAGNVGSFIQKISSLAILWVGAHLVMERALTVGELIAFQMMSSRAIEPILRLTNTWQDFQQVRLSIERLGDILNSSTERKIGASAHAPLTFSGDIAFENVCFHYRLDSPLVLDHISLFIPRGKTIGIVGRSGSGKSTLTKLLERLYLPESGRIKIDGIDLAHMDPVQIRRQIGVVLQESFLFNGSIRENISISVPGASMEDIIRAAKLSGAHDFISEFPEGYDTVVGERGDAISGGQRQRIAIARALMTNPKILIFDEATSALDYEAEHAIKQNLARIAAGRTMIMIAHRLSTIRHADRIIVLEKGQIAEEGTHEDLLSLHGIYASLYKKQGGDLSE